MNALTNFTTPFATALRVLNREGQPWFIAKDVCETLGLTNTARALASLPDTDKHYQSVGLHGRPPAFINESGFYKLVLKSRKPEARKFQDWVTGVVLPAIRKDGGYILGEEKVVTGEMDAGFIRACNALRCVCNYSRSHDDLAPQLGGANPGRTAAAPRGHVCRLKHPGA